MQVSIETFIAVTRITIIILAVCLIYLAMRVANLETQVTDFKTEVNSFIAAGMDIDLAMLDTLKALRLYLEGNKVVPAAELKEITPNADWPPAFTVEEIKQATSPDTEAIIARIKKAQTDE